MNKLHKTHLSVAIFLLLSVGSASMHASSHGNHTGQMGGGHDMVGEGMHGEGMHGEGMTNMREVMGTGRLNKIMADRGMVNINHEPMPDMNWPKMRMNFQVQDGVDLSKLKLGDEVEFTLMVDDDNNYVIKNIKTK